MSALEKQLISLADEYDFAKGFFKPTKTEMLDESPLSNFGILLSVALRQRMFVYDWPAGKFDHVTYFLYFFLSQAFSVQNSKKLKADLNIDKIFWRFEGNTKLKIFVVSKVENSKGRVMMKSFMFSYDKATEKVHNWSDEDFTDILVKLGKNAKFYQFESHHYDIKTKRNLAGLDKGQVHGIGFRIEALYDLSIKIKPCLLKSVQRKSFSRLREISGPIEEGGTIKYTEEFLESMLFHPEKRELIKESSKDFPNHLIKTFKQNFNGEKSMIPEAHCAFMHGILFPFQQRFNFHAQIAQYSNEKPATHFTLFMQKKQSTEWKHIVYDYPFIFHIVDSSRSIDKLDIEKRAVAAMVEHAKYKQVLAPNTFADATLMNYVNFNARTATVVQNELKVSGTPYSVISKSLGDATVALTNRDGSMETKEGALGKIADYLHFQLKYDILANKLLKNGLCKEDSRCLSRYFLGLLSSVPDKSYVATNIHETSTETTNFVFGTSSPNTHVMLAFHESDSFNLEKLEAIQEKMERIPYIKESNLLCLHVMVAYGPSPVESGDQKLPKMQILGKFFTETKPNPDYIVEPIEHMNLKHKALKLTSSADNDPSSILELQDFIQSKAKFFRNVDDFASFTHGSLHEMQTIGDVANPARKTVQLAYIVRDDLGKRLVLINSMFGKAAEVDEDLTKFADLYKSSLKRGTSDVVDIVSLALIENEETKQVEAEVLTKYHLLNMGVCGQLKSSRLRRSGCNRVEEKAHEEKAMRNSLNEKLRFFKRAGKISNGVMTGLMVKNFVADLIQGNFEGIAVNFAFIMANAVAHIGSAKLMMQGGKLTEEGKLLLGGALKAGAPFLARSPSVLFVGYDLYTLLRNNETSIENKVAIDTDAAYLSLDLAEAAIDLAELAGLIEGVSAFTGPIGWTIGATLLVCADVYRAVKQVEKIEAALPLTNSEKILEGIRGFIGLGPSRKIEDLVSAKMANAETMSKVLNKMTSKSTLKRYILPIVNNQKCEYDIYMNLNLPKKRFPPTRVLTHLPNEYSYFCYTSDYENCLKKNFLETFNVKLSSRIFSQECHGAAGIERKSAKESGHSYYHLPDGNDHVTATLQNSNIFEIGNGRKFVVGGKMDDVFLLVGNKTTGQFVGGEGKNLLDISNMQINSSLSIDGKIIYNVDNDTSLQIHIILKNFDEFRGRPQKLEFVMAWCSLQKLNTLGGSGSATPDGILIPDSSCAYNLTLAIHSNTVILNYARFGTFRYQIIKGGSGSSRIIVEKFNTEAFHIFTFEQGFDEFSSVVASRTVPKKIIFKSGVESRIIVKISSLRKVRFVFKDGVQFYFHRKEILATLNTTSDMTAMQDFYASVLAESTLSMVIHNIQTNETVTLSKGQHHLKNSKSMNILHSDPDHRTCLIGGSHENVFSISPYLEQGNCVKFHDVSIKVDAKSKNVIDLKKVKLQVEENHSDVVLKLSLKEGNITVLKVEYKNENHSCGSCIGTVRLYNPIFTENTAIIHEGQWNLRYKNTTIMPYLEPTPLYFKNSENIIIISDNDLELNTKILIDRTLGKHYTLYTSNDSMLITNIPSESNFCDIVEHTKTDLITVFLIGYQQSESMQSLRFKFNDQELTMGNEILDNGNDMKIFEKMVDTSNCIWQCIMKLSVLVPHSFFGMIEADTLHKNLYS